MAHSGRARQWFRVATAAAVGVGALVTPFRAGAATDESSAQPSGQPADDQSATTQPSAPQRPDGAGDEFRRGRPGRPQAGFGGGGGGGPMGVGRRWFGQPQVDMDPTAAIDFMSQHAPLYWAWVKANLPEENQRRIESMVTTAYVSYQRFRDDSPELYAVIVKRVEAEDGLFGLRMKVRAMPLDARQSMASQVRAQVTAWCKLSLQERSLRLARLKQTVDAEEKTLADDEAKRDDTINRRIEVILNGGGGGGGFPGGPGFRGDGFRGDGGNRGGNATTDSGDTVDPGHDPQR